MLKIRKEQKDALREREIRDFENRMWAHLRILFPAYCEPLGEVRVKRLVRLGIERAAKYGIISERGVCIYVDAMFAFGRDFDADPALGWAKDILTDRSIEGEFARSDRLMEEALNRLEDAPGIRMEDAA